MTDINMSDSGQNTDSTKHEETKKMEVFKLDEDVAGMASEVIAEQPDTTKESAGEEKLHQQLKAQQQEIKELTTALEEKENFAHKLYTDREEVMNEFRKLCEDAEQKDLEIANLKTQVGEKQHDYDALFNEANNKIKKANDKFDELSKNTESNLKDEQDKYNALVKEGQDKIDQLVGDRAMIKRRSTLYRTFSFLFFFMIVALLAFGWYELEKLTNGAQQEYSSLKGKYDKLKDSYTALEEKYNNDTSAQAYQTMTQERDQALTASGEKDMQIADLTSQLETAKAQLDTAKAELETAKKAAGAANKNAQNDGNQQEAGETEQPANNANTQKEDTEPTQAPPEEPTPAPTDVPAKPVVKNNPPKVIQHKRVQKPVAKPVAKKPIAQKKAAPAPAVKKPATPIQKRPNIMDLL